MILHHNCTGNTLQLVHQMLKEGAVYQVAPFKGMLAATICNQLEVLSWNEEDRTLEVLCRYSNTILALFLKTHGDFILVCTNIRPGQCM